VQLATANSMAQYQVVS